MVWSQWLAREEAQALARGRKHQTADGGLPSEAQVGGSEPPTLSAAERKEIEVELELEEAEREYLEARQAFRTAEKRWRAARSRAGRPVRRRVGARGPSTRAERRRARIAVRMLLATVAFWPLAAGIWEGGASEVVVRVGLAVVAFAFLSLCPSFAEELTIDPKGRAWQALAGVVLGGSFGLSRVLISDVSPWGATEHYKKLVELLANVRVGPVVGLLELLPMLVAAGLVEGIVFGGMLRWVVGKPRGPFPTWAAVALAAVAFAWMNLWVPKEYNYPFALVSLVNGAVIAIGTFLTASPLLAGAFLGVQWWVCLATYYVVRL